VQSSHLLKEKNSSIMQYLVRIVLFCLCIAVGCKPTQKVSQNDVQKTKEHLASLVEQYGFRQSAFQVNDSQILETLQKLGPHQQFEDVFPAEQLLLEARFRYCGKCNLNLYTTVILPKFKSAKNTAARIAVMNQYPDCFVLPDSIRVQK
jgi:hypothetical protein